MIALEASAVPSKGYTAEVPLWVAGEPYTPGHEPEETRAPATDELLAKYYTAGPEDADIAVAVALQAQREWARVPLAERARRVRELAGRLTAKADDFGLLDARDTGTPVRTMRAGALKGAKYLEMCAGVAFEMKGQTIPASTKGWHLTFPRPLGVVTGIAAFNHPTLFACQKMGPPLVAGNSMVLKPAEQAPLSGVLLAALGRDLFPPGVLNVLSGDAAIARHLVTHRDVAAITFTGSAEAGLEIQRGAASSGRFKRLILECGGKNPILVYPDADLGSAARAVVRGTNFTRNQGQSCGSTSRLLVHRDVHREVVDRVISEVESINLGLPEYEETQMGALITAAHRDYVVKEVRAAKEEGAHLLLGGNIPTGRPDLAQGAYMEPAVLDGVTPDMEIALKEIFGPVLAMLPCVDEDEMVTRANDTEYGLTASIWSQDIDRAISVAEAIEAGYLWINDVETRYPGVPFGGWKQSGIGLEQALTHEILDFTRTKSINIDVKGCPG